MSKSSIALSPSQSQLSDEDVERLNAELKALGRTPDILIAYLEKRALTGNARRAFEQVSSRAEKPQNAVMRKAEELSPGLPVKAIAEIYRLDDTGHPGAARAIRVFQERYLAYMGSNTTTRDKFSRHLEAGYLLFLQNQNKLLKSLIADINA